MTGPLPAPPRTLGRYLMAGPIAVGGMASVHFGKLNGPVGFRRTVAIKRMLQSYASSREARSMLIDEARLTARINHGNVVQTLDVIEEANELYLVLEYAHGESLDHLLERCQELAQRPPVGVAVAVLAGVLRGLHAAHEAKGEDGAPLELVHRDLSPHNVIVDVYGVPRVLDFGVARARGRLQGTRDGQIKGKLAYLAPEQVHGEASRASDLFTAGVVLWECLCGRQLFTGRNEADLLSNVLLCKVPPLASEGVDHPALQAVLDRALCREPAERYRTAAEMADALERCAPATPTEVAAWVNDVAMESLGERTRCLDALDRYSGATELPAASGAPMGPMTPRPVPPNGNRQALVVVGVIGLVAALAAALVIRVSIMSPLQAPIRPLPAPVPAAAPAEPPTKQPELAARPEGPAPPAPKPAPVEPAKKRPNCNPPYVIDKSGVKRFKVECLD